MGINRRSLFQTMLAPLVAKIWPKKKIDPAIAIHRLSGAFDTPEFRAAVRAFSQRLANDIDRRAADHAFSQIRQGETINIRMPQKFIPEAL